jgi:hypothetical protein
MPKDEEEFEDDEEAKEQRQQPKTIDDIREPAPGAYKAPKTPVEQAEYVLCLGNEENAE